MKSRLLLLFTLFGFIFIQAQPTKITVRAKAKDAKFIGTSVGGALILIRNADTGELLAGGRTVGSTGNTRKIMMEDHRRYTQLSDDQTAKFVASLELDEPQLLTIEALVPYTKKQARIMAQTQVWLIPGKDITGDGIVLEIPGFIIDILEPRTHQFIEAGSLPDRRLTIRANMVMMCGCTISDGGLWDGGKMEVEAMIKRNGKVVKNVPLSVSNTPNLFEGSVELEEGGAYEVIVHAFDPRSNNTGADKVNFVLE